MDKVIIKVKNDDYSIQIEGEDFYFNKKGKGNVVVEQEQDCFDLKFKELNMPNLTFDISENGNYIVSFNATINIPQKEIVVINNEAIISIPDGEYTINSITFESASCVKPYNTPFDINCPAIPKCNCTGENNGNFTIGEIQNVAGNFYSVPFNACNVNPFDWKVLNEAGTIVKEDSVVPTSSVVTINLSGLLNGNYKLVASSTGCQGTAEKTFSINKDVIITPFQIGERSEMYGLRISKNNGKYTDISEMSIPNGYTPYYLINEYYIGNTFISYDLSNLKGNPVLIRKLVLKNSTFPTYESFLQNGYLANIPDTNGNIHSNSQLLDII